MKKFDPRLGGLAAVLFCASLLCAQSGEEADPAPAPVSETVAARLDDAAAIVAALKGKKGPERLDGMRGAAEAYESVARDFGTDANAVARSLWEAGECWRRAGELEKAADAYGRLLDGEPGRYLQRAAFERASMLRRLKDYDGALKLYGTAGGIDAEGVRAHDARLWVARVQELRGDPEAAIVAYRAATDAAVGPRRLIEACDALAKALIRRGDLDGARASITRADDAVRPLTGKGGQEAERLARALSEMGSRRQLQRAVDKTSGAAKDAVRLEQERGGDDGR